MDNLTLNEHNNNTQNSILQHALELAQRGRFVFPASNSKKPFIKDWPNLASVEEAQIKKWFDKVNPPNIAVVTGHKSGFFCLDIDGDEGKKSLDELQALHGSLPMACVAKTPSGGLHVYFQMPDGKVIRNSASKVGECIDVRGIGGYVLLPGRRAKMKTEEIKQQ